jgi:hypothetical protein
VTSKVRRPRLRPSVVLRPRLREALARNEDRRLTLVSAPAGFGKTTLLGEWLEDRSGDERSVAWVSLDESDNDPARFLAYLVAALHNVGEVIGQGAGRWLGSIPRLLKLVVLSPFVSQLPPPNLSMLNKKDSMAVFREFLEGKLPPVIDRTYSLGEVPEAIRYLEEGHTQGKVVITL